MFDLKNAFVRSFLAFAAVVVIGGGLWFDWNARVDGFQGYFDRRAAHAAGILSGAEWRGMRAAGDTATVSSGGSGCVGEACRMASAVMAGKWAGAGGCASGNFYRFSDDFAEVTTLKDGAPVESVRRSFRVVSAPVVLRPLRDAQGRALERTISKLPGDIEVFTIGRSSYVRRILRAVDADTIKLVLVEQRTGGAGPALAVVVDGRATLDGAEIGYRRCAEA